MRKAFTLIEVMVAVLIVSVVIMALLQMRQNNTHLFLNLNEKNKNNQFLSFFIANSDYGFEKKDITLDKLLADFEIENDLRQALKNSKVEVIYQELGSIDFYKDYSGYADANMSQNIVFERGKTILKTQTSSSTLLRLKN